MGRSSVEATKACLMRAVRARRAALLVRLACFLALPAVLLAGFDAFVPAAAGLLVFCAGFPAAFFAVVAVSAGGGAEPPFADPLVDCAETGRTIISQGNRTAMQREASRGAGVEDFTKLMPSLYAAFGLLRSARTSAVTAKYARMGATAPVPHIPDVEGAGLVPGLVVRYTRL